MSDKKQPLLPFMAIVTPEINRPKVERLAVGELKAQNVVAIRLNERIK